MKRALEHTDIICKLQMPDAHHTRKPSEDSFPKQIAARLMDWAGLVANRGRLLPPFSMRRAIGEGRWQLRGGEFKRQGADFVAKLKQDAGLNAHSRVLDVGCGCGRVAIALTEPLAAAEYAGLEPNREMVNWCSANITTRFPRFQFTHQDLFNALYNPEGTLLAEAARFPFEGEQFDIVVATSVFTHLGPAAVANYARECSRVMTPRGRLFASFFLIENQAKSPGLNFAFTLEADVARTIDAEIPEKAISYRLDWLTAAFERENLFLLPPVRWGSWTGSQNAYSWQDVLIFEKRA